MAPKVRVGTAMDKAMDRLRMALDLPADPSSDFDLNPQRVAVDPASLRPAAVLVAFRQGPVEPELLLTVRSSKLKHHPGQIAFPGGKLDPCDADASSCALREAWEEVALPDAQVDLIAPLPAHETVTRFCVTPWVGRIDGDFDPRPDPGEVAEAFWVPLSHIGDPARFSIQRRRWRGEWRRYYTVPYGPYYIWGATARMLFGLATRLSHVPSV